MIRTSLWISPDFYASNIIRGLTDFFLDLEKYSGPRRFFSYLIKSQKKYQINILDNKSEKISNKILNRNSFKIFKIKY